MKLTDHQQRLLRTKLSELMDQGKVKHVGLLGAPCADWDQTPWVMGTTEDMLGTGMHCPCRDCGDPTFTSVQYPKDVAIVCEGCAYELLVGPRLFSSSG